MSYRVNFGNGQVSNTYDTKREACEVLWIADEQGAYAWLQKYEAGSADCPGEWVTCRSHDVKR